MTNRRNFIKLMGAAVTGYGLVRSQAGPVAASTQRDYQGADFTGWEVVVGDGLYTVPGEPSVTPDDIETIHYGSYSELRANIQVRDIMAHNITFKRVIDETAFDFVHTCQYMFRLPYLPATGNSDLNPQTVEGGLFIWDGGDTRLDYGLAFQWMLNPWGGSDFEFGDLRCWTDRNDGSWERVGYLEPDTAWHTINLVFDFRRETTALLIDGSHFPCQFTATPKAASWGTETAARLQAEIISIYPEGVGDGRLHKTHFKDWTWTWMPYSACEMYLPVVSK
jgi:hypothetical protein